MRFSGKLEGLHPNGTYGFVEKDGGRSIFVHVSELHRAGIEDARVGDILEYSIGWDPSNRQRAVDVERIQRAAS